MEITSMIVNQLHAWVTSVIFMETIIILGLGCLIMVLIIQSYFFLKWIVNTKEYEHYKVTNNLDYQSKSQQDDEINPNNITSQSTSISSAAFLPPAENHPKPTLNRIPYFWRIQLVLIIIILGAIINIFLPVPQVSSPIPPIAEPIPVDEANPLTITFNRPIKADELEINLTPSVSGQWVFESQKFFFFDEFVDVVKFYPNETLLSDYEYTLSMNNIHGYWFNHKAENYLFLFKTPYDPSLANANKVKLPKVEAAGFPVGPLMEDHPHPVELVPAHKQSQVSVSQPLEITFNKRLQTGLVADQFIINPETEGTISWEEDENNGVDVSKMIFTPENDWLFGTNYMVMLKKGVQDISGLNADQTYIFQFSTAPQKFELDIPWYRQQNKFTCYAGAARMVLAYYDINLTENEIIDNIGFVDTKRSFIRNIWGDPNEGIVGTIDGSDSGGYGTHWDPVGKMIEEYRDVDIKRNWNLNDLLHEVKAGHPVMVWWVNGVWPAKDVSWKDEDGNRVYTVNGMHVEVVKGWIGDQADPDYILTNDPWRGDRRYDPDTFNNLWSWFDNTAVVVR